MTDREGRLGELRSMPRCGGVQIARNDSVDGLIEMLEFAKPQRVLEIGSSKGVSTEVFLLHCEHVTAVDPWELWPYYCGVRTDFKKNCQDKYSNLTCVQGFSPGALAGLEPASFDLVYIDGNHEYQALIDDVRGSFALVRSGGWIAGHDYWPAPGYRHVYDVVPAVHDVLGKPDRVFSDSSWIVRRPEALLEPPTHRAGQIAVYDVPEYSYYGHIAGTGTGA